MEAVNRSELQALLTGVPLPAGRDELVRYARNEGADGRQLQALRSLTAYSYGALQDVGEELVPAQPPPPPPVRPRPRPESGRPPGDERYTA
jgi:hypothetical protein